MAIDSAAADKEKRENIRAFLASAIGGDAGRFDREQSVPPAVIRALASHGVMSTQVPAEYGGRPLDAGETGILCEEIGRISCSILSLLTVHTMVCQAITKWGNDWQHRTWLPSLASGEVLGAFALTEPEIGSDISSVGTIIVRDGDHFILRGRKKWISFAQIAGLFLVAGNCEGKLISVLVPRSAKGLSIKPIRDMRGFRGAMLGELELDNCMVPVSHLVGSLSLGKSQIVGSMLDHGRYSIAWGAVGLAEACLAACLDYTQERVQFGQPLCDHQMIQQMIADMVVNIQAARLLCEHAAALRHACAPGAIMATNMAKYFASEAADKIAADALQIHGANGFCSEYSVHRHMEDAKVLKVIEGSSQMHQILIARHSYQSKGGQAF